MANCSEQLQKWWINISKCEKKENCVLPSPNAGYDETWRESITNLEYGTDRILIPKLSWVMPTEWFKIKIKKKV